MTRNRYVGNGAVIALLGLLAGLLLLSIVNTRDALAQRAPNAPEKVYALTTGDRLLRFDGDDPRRVMGEEIRGLRGGEGLVGIDFRPSGPDVTQGKLYGLGDEGYIYTINARTATAERGPRITADDAPVALRGTSFGIDFNPTVDRLRIVSDANQNLRVNVDTGALADSNATVPGTQPDGDLRYAVGDPKTGQDPAVTGVAYRNSQPAALGTTNTELYDIDANTNDMSEQDPPNDGTLVTEGPLGVNTNRPVGFDVVTRGTSPDGDRGFAALRPMRAGSSAFYAVDLDTGDATRIGTIGGNANVEGLAIPIGHR